MTSMQPPDSRSSPTTGTRGRGGQEQRPHLHVGAAMGPNAATILGGHVPTGRVAMEDVLRLLIELGVQPRRDDWQAVLDETQSAFERWRSWGGGLVETAESADSGTP